MRKAFILFIILFTVYLSEAQYSWSDTVKYKIASAKISLASAKNDATKYYWLNNIYYYYVFSTPDSCLPYAQQSLTVAKQMKSDTLISDAYVCLGYLYYTIGNYPQALAYYQEGLKYAESSRYFLSKVFACINLSYVYVDEEDFDDAFFYAKESKTLMEANWKPSFNIPTTFNNLAGAPDLIHDTLTHYLFALESLGEVYEQFNYIDSAYKYYRLMNDGFLKSHEGIMDWGVIPYHLGSIYARMKNYSESARYYHIGITIALKTGIEIDILKNSSGLASLYKETGATDSSIFYAAKVLEVSTYNYNPMFKLNALNLLTGIYKSKNNVDSLAKYLQLTISTKDSLFSQQKVMQLQTMTFNEQRRQQELQQQLAQASLVYRNRLNIYFLLTGLVILIIVAVGLWRRNVYKQRSYALLEKQKQEIDFQKTKVENTLSDLKSTQSQLIQSEKMASLGELTAGIAHEIQNPLNFVNNFSDVNTELADELQTELRSGNTEEAITIAQDIKDNEQKINYHGKRADSIVKGMLQHSRASSGQKELTDINKLADEYLRLSYHGMRAKDKSFNAEYKTEFDESIGKINVVPQDIGRVLLNLFNNAFYAVNERAKLSSGLGAYEPTVSVCTKLIPPLPGRLRGAEIRVSDNGNGIPQDIVDKIFQPFFTTKPTGQGTGLGLSLAYDIVKAHGGDIKVEIKEAGRTEFIVRLPAITEM
jgi:signal transduction histidine kinase